VKHWSYFLGGKWEKGKRVKTIYSPYKNIPVGEVGWADADILNEAIEKAHNSFPVTSTLPTYKRKEILTQIARGIKKRKEEFARIIAQEAGKPIQYSRGEVARAIATFNIAAEETDNLTGEIIPLDVTPAGEGRIGVVQYFPIGVAGAITPFNFPLNLVAHKLAPAIAAGNPIVLKPSSSTPITAILLAEVIAETSLPSASISIIPCDASDSYPLINNKAIKILTFTGSAEVGWQLKQKAWEKRVTLELGGNAAVIVDSGDNLDYIIEQCVKGSFAYSGQICISIQRIYVKKELFSEFLHKFLQKTAILTLGDPLEETTDIGPMINQASVEKVMLWLKEATQKGAKILIGGEASENFILPTVLTNTTPEMKVWSEEVFAPLVLIEPYTTFKEALELANKTSYGLQCGVFTSDIEKMYLAFQKLEVGGVIINDIPTFRVDNMPYGGVKRSGIGKEGVKYAIREMTEMKLMVVNLSYFKGEKI